MTRNGQQRIIDRGRRVGNREDYQNLLRLAQGSNGAIAECR